MSCNFRGFIFPLIKLVIIFAKFDVSDGSRLHIYLIFDAWCIMNFTYIHCRDWRKHYLKILESLHRELQYLNSLFAMLETMITLWYLTTQISLVYLVSSSSMLIHF